VRLTHIGGPTVLIQVAGWRLLTDPTFDPPGRKYSFGWGTSSVKLAGPAIGASDVEPIDAVLLTHDHHDDNLDPAGRALLHRLTPSSRRSQVQDGSTEAPVDSSPGSLRRSKRRDGRRSRSLRRRAATARH
jgi:L-ascorbate metabolism protein UlaG (beta-lactamase superfamily)